MTVETTPAPRLSTRDRLKLTARRLFAERGPGGVTVRDILTASEEKNGASLNYYFRTKEELIREIVQDVFVVMDERWGDCLARLTEHNSEPTVRDCVRVLVQASDTSDVEEVPTTARLANAFAAHEYRGMVMGVMKERRLVNYDKVLGLIAARLSHIPPHLLRQRLIFLTHYLSSMFALNEAARIEGSQRQIRALGIDRNQGNLIDTAVGLLTADPVDGLEQDEDVADLPQLYELNSVAKAN